MLLFSDDNYFRNILAAPYDLVSYEDGFLYLLPESSDIILSVLNSGRFSIRDPKVIDKVNETIIKINELINNV